MTPYRRATLGAALTAALSAATLAMAGTVASAAPPPSLSSVVIANVGPGYAVMSQGPVDPGQFASSAPNPSATQSALGGLSGSVSTYQRVWQDTSMHNEVQDLVVHLPSAATARTFAAAAEHSLSTGEVVKSVALPQIKGALLTTYFASTSTQVGVGQAITLRSGPYVMLLSTFSASADNPQPINESDAVTIALAQRAAVERTVARTADATSHRSSRSSLGAATLIGACIVLGAVALWAVRRARKRVRSADVQRAGSDQPVG